MNGQYEEQKSKAAGYDAFCLSMAPLSSEARFFKGVWGTGSIISKKGESSYTKLREQIKLWKYRCRQEISRVAEAGSGYMILQPTKACLPRQPSRESFIFPSSKSIDIQNVSPLYGEEKEFVEYLDEAPQVEHMVISKPINIVYAIAKGTVEFYRPQLGRGMPLDDMAVDFLFERLQRVGTAERYPHSLDEKKQLFRDLCNVLSEHYQMKAKWSIETKDMIRLFALEKVAREENDLMIMKWIEDKKGEYFQSVSYYLDRWHEQSMESNDQKFTIKQAENRINLDRIMYIKHIDKFHKRLPKKRKQELLQDFMKISLLSIEDIVSI
jgi:hypothetical protein